MFYRFRQNNTGGSWDINDDLTVRVIIEADSADEANRKAKKLGMYWYGSDHDGPDCPCCGDRWTQVYDYDGEEELTYIAQLPNFSYEEVPLTADTELSVMLNWAGNKPYMYVYFKDGTKWELYCHKESTGGAEG